MRFLVVSYDDDQQQWFYDTVEAPTEQDAVAHICRIRPYVIAADASTPEQVRGMANQIVILSAEQIKREHHSIERESHAR